MLNSYSGRMRRSGKRLRRLACLGLASIVCWTSTAYSQGEAVLSWTPPVENTDGSVLTDLAGYRVYWGQEPGNYPNSVTLDDRTEYTVEGLAAGEWYFAATAVNSVGEESDFSNEATKTIESSTGWTVDPNNLAAYSIVQSLDAIVLVPVGSVAPGTVCDTTQSANGRFVVPRASVTFAGSVEPQVLFAECIP